MYLWVIRMRIEGFSPAAALDLLASSDTKPIAGLTPLIRSELAAWISWLRSTEGPTGSQRITAIEWLLEAAQARHPEHDDALIALFHRWSIAQARTLIDGLAHLPMFGSNWPRLSELIA